MFKKRTLFIVGAGASAEYKLPVGNELASRISKRLDVKYDRFGREPNSGDIELLAMRNEMDKAQKIVYLGFAFHDQNLKLLKPIDPLGRKWIYGTAFGMSPSDVSVVKAQLMAEFNDRERQTIEDKIFLEPSHRCADLFDFYAKSLPN